MRIHPTIESNNIIVTEFNDNCDNCDSNDSLVCAICLDNVSTDHKFLSCNHLFHPKCIVHWSSRQKKNYIKPTCPLCKLEYEYNKFSNNILLYHINYIESYIKKFRFVLQNGYIPYIDRKYIKYLLKNYKKLNSKLHHEYKSYIECSCKSWYLTCSIIPIPEYIIQIISVSEQQYKEKNKNKNKNKNIINNNIKLLSIKYLNHCKSYIIVTLKIVYKYL